MRPREALETPFCSFLATFLARLRAIASRVLPRRGACLQRKFCRGALPQVRSTGGRMAKGGGN